MNVTLYFPDFERVVELPAVPRKGEYVQWQEKPGDDASEWIVTEVRWALGTGMCFEVGITLDPTP